MAELSDPADIREAVRAKYALAAQGCGGAQCCDTTGFGAALYDDATRAEAPRGALDASLGCGVPTAVADLHEGETVLDLGSGAGADVLLSARRVGLSGRAIGIDMTDEMLERARANAQEAGLDNVEFLKGYLEDLPLADESVDVVISNCVINLTGDKPRVIQEAARVLRPGGRLAVSDVIADADLAESTRSDISAWTGCIAGALTEAELRTALKSAGFEAIEIRETHRVHAHAGAAIIRARKPEAPRACGCGLDAAGLATQLDRYRALARHVADIEHDPNHLVVRFAEDPPGGLLERTLEVERGCCPFFEIEHEPAGRRLTISVDDASRRSALDGIAAALSRA